MNSIIIVPYRNRSSHLAQFLSHMAKYYKGYPICIVEQSDEKPFNRGKLLNIGYLENIEYRNYIFHDIDMLPVIISYEIKYNVPIVQLAKSDIQIFDYLGGVTRFSNTIFKKIGGYNNEFWHRAEDNEMMFNIKRLGFNVIRKPGEYKILDHKREGLEFDPALWEKAQQPRENQNQLSLCEYKIENSKVFGNVKQLTVTI